jgi:hypothetical protein
MMRSRTIATYTGPVTVVMPDATECAAHAEQLVVREQFEEIAGDRIEGLKSWDGTLSSDECVWFDLVGESATIRVNGRPGTFVLRNQMGEHRVAIVGSGAPPFS